jgi:hypothetical protein
MKNLHAHIDWIAAQARLDIAKQALHAHAHIDGLIEQYRIEDAFRNRSLAQKRRWENFRKFQGGGK